MRVCEVRTSEKRERREERMGDVCLICGFFHYESPLERCQRGSSSGVTLYNELLQPSLNSTRLRSRHNPDSECADKAAE